MKEEKDTLGDRMKRYEGVSRQFLMRRNPVIIRIDGRAFHTFTRGLEKPFCTKLRACMVMAAAQTMHSMQGCEVAYHQSDEVSFLLTDYADISTEGWFGYNQQKIVSLVASEFTAQFAMAWGNLSARFDARAFSIPKDEVANYFLWRLRDWSRNSIQMLAQAHYSQSRLQGKAIPAVHEMLFEKGINWAHLEDHWKNGTFVTKGELRSDILPNFAATSEFLQPYIEPSASLEAVAL